MRERLGGRYQRIRSEAMRVGYIKAIDYASRLGRLHPLARDARKGVGVIRNLPYRGTGSRAHTLDVYRPHGATDAPVVLYIHGGAFEHLSKDTHWMMGLAFASRGYVVFNINYRLAPRHPFPAAIEDASAALLWARRHARRYGGDPERIIIAGESAGGNLATALTLATRHAIGHGKARAVFEAGIEPRACIAACGVLQVTDTIRLSERRRRPLPHWVVHQLITMTDNYLPARSREEPLMPLADPLVFLERADATDRPLPPFFAFAGTRDPLLDDTRRLGAALERRGVRCETRVYKGEIHAFHAVVWREQARTCWQEQFEFLDDVLRD